MLLSGPNWPQHRPWSYLFLAGTLGAAGWFAAASIGQPVWPGGSSLPGFTFGVIGGLIILFEFLLWARKKLRVWRVGRAQTWMRAHIWLGLLCVPLLWLHGGLRFGGLLSTTLTVILWIVVGSGIVGLWLQTRLPKRMLEDLPAETIYSQIGQFSRQLEAEAAGLVSRVCGKPELATSEPTRFDEGHLVVGAIRRVGMVQGAAVGTLTIAKEVPGAAPLADFFRETVIPFLRGETKASPLSERGTSAVVFENLRTLVPREAHETVNQLESYCERRRQWQEQARLHFWLHAWLWLHFPLSVSLLVLMAAHVFAALKYY